MKPGLIDSPFWTLAQALDWIAYRDADKATAGTDIGSGPAIEEAKAALWQKLLSGVVRANGRRNGERREIQEIEWLDLSPGSASAKPFLSGNGHRFFPGKGTVALARIVATQGDVTTAGNEARRPTITYSDVRLARDDVLREWPARTRMDMMPKRRGPKTNKTESLKRSLLVEMRAGTYRPGKQEAQAKKYKVSRETFVKAEAAALSEFQPSEIPASDK